VEDGEVGLGECRKGKRAKRQTGDEEHLKLSVSGVQQKLGVCSAGGRSLKGSIKRASWGPKTTEKREKSERKVKEGCILRSNA